MSTIRRLVRARLSDGRSVDEIWDELDRCHWNYINRLNREWKREQEALRQAIHAGADRKP